MDENNYSDGIPDNYYRTNSHLFDEKLEHAECCNYYYYKDAYEHKNKYGLYIQGMTTCIHCYISFNIDKYTTYTNLNDKEIECLKYYVEHFTNNHNINNCTRRISYGRCILCESKVGVPPFIINANTSEKDNYITDDDNDDINEYIDCEDIEDIIDVDISTDPYILFV